MKKWAVMGHVVGSKFLGIFEAETKEEAEDMAIESDAASVSLCHQCSSECEDAEVDYVEAEED
jgi:Fe-S cluster assembly iron-binding protein IscA